MTNTGILFYSPRNSPISDAGTLRPGAYYQFFLTGGFTPANVYRDGALTTPFAASQSIGSYAPATDKMPAIDGSGRAPVIFLDNTLAYRVQFWDPIVGLVWQVDPVVPGIGGVFGSKFIRADAYGQYTIAPTGSTNGAALTVASNSALGDVALLLKSTVNAEYLGNVAPAMVSIKNSAIATGTQTATFSASNKPGSGNSSVAKWLPLLIDGTIFYAPMFA